MKALSHRFAGRWFVFGLVVLMALADCSSDTPHPQPMPNVEATPTFAPKPTFTPAISPTELPTATPEPTDTPAPTATPTPNPNVNPLTGLEVDDPSVLKRRPLLVRVGNDPVARSVQAGLSQADVVYEEITEGWGVTRYTGVFLSQDPEMIRPIRSARLLNIELAFQYDAAMVHSGAHDKVRWLISQLPIVDLDEFFHPEPYTYGQGDWRTRLYTSAPALREYLKRRGFEKEVNLEGWHFDKTLPEGSTPATEVYIPYPNGAVTWHYNPGTGLYERLVDGTRAVDAGTGKQIAVSNVVAFYTEHRNTDMRDSQGSILLEIVMQGEGPIQLFRDGVMVEGVWRRNEAAELTRFYDKASTPLALKPGQSWIEVLPTNVPDYNVQIMAR